MVKTIFITGSSLGWTESKLDITEYAGYDNLMIRFRVITDGSVQNDGWYIDDVTINEATATIPYPFADAMNDSTSNENWFSSNWQLVEGGNSAPSSFHDSPYSRYPDNIYSAITLANSIDLTDAVKPQLTSGINIKLKIIITVAIGIMVGFRFLIIMERKELTRRWQPIKEARHLGRRFK